MPVLSLACHLPHNTPHIPSRYNNEQTTKQTKAINNSYIYIYISCKCDTNRAGHFTLDAYASRPVACVLIRCNLCKSIYSQPSASLGMYSLTLWYRNIAEYICIVCVSKYHSVVLIQLVKFAWNFTHILIQPLSCKFLYLKHTFQGMDPILILLAK